LEFDDNEGKRDQSLGSTIRASRGCREARERIFIERRDLLRQHSGEEAGVTCEALKLGDQGIYFSRGAHFTQIAYEESCGISLRMVTFIGGLGGVNGIDQMKSSKS